MLRQSLRGLAAVGVAALALGPAPAAAVTQLTGCATLTKAGETYVLTQDVNNSGNECFRIQADRITLDLGGYTVTGPGPGIGASVWDEDNPRTNTVVRNGTLTNAAWGILFQASTRTTVRNITVVENTNGIVIGSDSLVKDCIAQRNSNGIVAVDRVQVENCVVGDAEPGAGVDGNSIFGIVGGQRMLITRTTSNGNGNSGILVGMRSTVSHSTASNNGNDGIAVGQNSLVTRNTANDNGGDGVEAVCPSTITHNTATGNGNLDINPVGAGCHIQHNTVSN
jgi:hypothetical protein